MQLGWFLLSLVVMLVGLVGTIIPFMPGIALVLAGAALYAIVTGFEAGIGWGHLGVYAVAAVLVYGFEILANALGARVFGGSRAGVLGALVGLLLGLLLGGPVGLLLGPFLGAFAFEFLSHRETRRALRSGLGAAVGFLASSVVEFAVAVGIAVSFVISVLSAG